MESDKGNRVYCISAHIAGDKNKNKNDKTFLLTIALNSSCASVQQTDESGTAKEVKKIFRLLPACSQKQKNCFMAVKRGVRSSTHWKHICYTLAAFAVTSFEKVSLKISLKGSGRRLKIAAGKK